MLVIARFAVEESSSAEFTAAVVEAVETMASKPGHVSSRLVRAIDDVTSWSLVSEWESVGAYRRALSKVDVRLASMALMGRVRDEPTSYEVLWDDKQGDLVSDHG